MAGSPGVSPDVWPLLLSETGFDRNICVTPESVPFGRFVLMAHSDGLIESVQIPEFALPAPRKTAAAQSIHRS